MSNKRPGMNNYKDYQNHWTTLESKVIYDNPWIRLEHRDVITPGGSNGIYGVVSFKNIAIGILPLDKSNHTWLVGQDRYVLQQYSWEIPEGGCPKNEAPLEAAKRELLEETGIVALEWIEVLRLHLSNSVTDEQAISYVARGLTFSEPDPDETEQLQIYKAPFQEVLEMAVTGDITDALSVSTILKVDYLLRAGMI